MNKQLVLVEFRNCSPFLYTIVSKDPITIERVAKHFEVNEGFNEDRDSITFIDEISEIEIDRNITLF